MIKFLLDVFCKDTIIGLSQFQDIKKVRNFKNKYCSLFSRKETPFSGKGFTDPILCHF